MSVFVSSSVYMNLLLLTLIHVYEFGGKKKNVPAGIFYILLLLSTLINQLHHCDRLRETGCVVGIVSAYLCTCELLLCHEALLVCWIVLL